MIFEARYAGECEACGEWFQPGALITYGESLYRYQHSRCPDDPDLTATTQPACPRCTARHVGEC